MNLKLPTMAEATAFYISAIVGAAEKGHQTIVEQHLAKTDLFFLLVYVLGRKDAAREWIYQRCREVESAPDGYLDLWAREHFKSSIITFALTIQDILNDPEISVGIFSFNRPTAKAFLRQIKREFEANEKLKSLFPEILWPNPGSEAPTWALDSETLVLTVSGWKSHGSLIPGDKIFGSQGQIITVTGNSGPTVGAECYRVVFDDCEIVASAEHLWPVQRRNGTHVSWDFAPIRIEQTQELVRDKARCRMLPTPTVEGDAGIVLPVDPYVLGYWLGNGTAGANVITMHREDEAAILRQMQDAGYNTYVQRRIDSDNFSMHCLSGLKEQLEVLGCLYEKFVPDIYLRADAPCRQSLLQGLMDSDGTCKKDGKRWTYGGMCMFSNTNRNLAESVFHLTTSLGMRPSQISFMPKQRARQRVYHTYFIGITSNPPFRLLRKLERCKEKRTKVARYFREIERVDSVTVNCITVDAEDHLYLAGQSLVPTHNSEDNGIVVKRQGNPKEATIEAYGLIDGQPTSKHYKLMVYDDVVTRDSVSTPDMIRKVTEAWELSRNLTTEGGKTRYIGTRYSHNDTYRTIIDRMAAIERRHPCTIDGTVDGEPVLWSRELVADKRREQGPYTFAAQMLLDPTSDRTHGFRDEWLRYYDAHGDHNHMNKYICVDAASSKKRESDYTAMAVIGLSGDQNFYLLDAVRDRMSLTERGNAVFELHKRWKPKGVAYEKYGQMSDIEYLKERMQRENYRFEIEEVGGQMSKHDRIRRMVPIFETGRFYLPETLIKIDYEGRHVDITRAFVDEEFRPFPVGLHEDLFDAISRIWDIGHVWPKEYSRNVDRYARPRLRRVGNVTYMAA